MFSDLAGTVPANAGEPAGRIVGARGQHHLAAPQDTKRPTYDLDASGRPHLVTASGDLMVSDATLVIKGPMFIVAAVSRSAAAGLPLFRLIKDSGNYAGINNVSSGQRAANVARYASGAVASVLPNIDPWPLDEIEVISAQLIDGAMDVRIGDLELSGLSPFTGGVEATGAGIGLNANSLTSGAAQVMRFYGGAVFYAKPTPRERDEIHQYYRERLGL